MRVNWTGRLEAGGVSWLNTPTASSEPPAEGRGGRQGKHAAHHNAERPPPRAVAKKQQKKTKRKGLRAAKGQPVPPEEGKGRGGEEGVWSERGTRHQWHDRNLLHEWQWMIQTPPSSIALFPPSSRSWMWMMWMWEWSWRGEKWTLL